MSLYFGFEDEVTGDSKIIDVSKQNAPKKHQPTERLSPSKLTISEIQELLSRDIDNENNSTLNESSFYDDVTEVETTVVEKKTPAKRKPRKQKKKAQENNENVKRVHFDEVALTEEEEKQARKHQLQTYRPPSKQKVLGSIENTVKPAKKTKTMKRIEENNENYEKLAEEMNKKFEQVESFKLLVE